MCRIRRTAAVFGWRGANLDRGRRRQANLLKVMLLVDWPEQRLGLSSKLQHTARTDVEQVALLLRRAAVVAEHDCRIGQQHACKFLVEHCPRERAVDLKAELTL